MAYLRRKIDIFLEDWKKRADAHPLIVKGARQIGKTESIMQFAKNNYKNVVYINFVENPRYKKITQDGYSVADIVKGISLVNPLFKFQAHKTIIIFDEMQEFPEIATALKFFSLDARFDVICTGSLLGINYQRIESNSVGYKEDYLMHSMDFEEFLWAKGYKNDVIDELLDCLKNIRPVGELLHKVMKEHFFDYSVLGGMPLIVRTYIEKGSFEGVSRLQQQLHLDYKEDISKYAVGLDKGRILNVYNHVAVQLAKENKKFQISKVAKGARFNDYRGCIEWLENSGLINVCYSLGFPELPLGGNYVDNKFKLYFADTGLLVALLDEESQMDLRANKNFGVYKGAVFENIIAEALVKQGLKLYYYKREDSTLEIDFFMRTQKHLVPLEVKAGNTQGKSLKEMVKSSKYKDVVFGVKLADANIGFSDNIYTVPYYCTFLLKKWQSLSQ